MPHTRPTATFSKAPSEEAAFEWILRAGVFSFLMFTAARTWADPDLWGHVRFGGDILSQGLSRGDSYSFTSDIPWTNHEWLAEVLMYLAWASGGNPGLVTLKMAAVSSTLFIVHLSIRSAVPSQMTRDLLLVLTIAGIWARVFVIRPQLFSLVLFALLLWILLSVERGRKRCVWWLPVLFAAWVNLHGGWLVGVGTLGVWAAATWAYGQSRPPLGLLLGGIALGLGATLVNPYGWGMWTFLAATVSPQRADIKDWQPLYRAGAEVIVPWALTAAAGLAAVARRPRSVPIPHLLIVLALAVGSFRVNRLDAFFTLAVVMLLAPHFGNPRVGSSRRPLWSRRARAAAAVGLLLALVLIVRSNETFTCLRMDGPWMPEREAGLLIERNQLRGRLITWFDWGQYAIWHFSPDLKVSIDGRRETVYSAGFLDEHLRLYFQPGAALALLDRLNGDYAWLPVSLPLVNALEERGWSRIYAGPASVVLGREPMVFAPAPGPLQQVCFPGP